MKQRHTSDKYTTALRTRLIRGQGIKQEAVKGILTAALSVKQLENHLTDIRSRQTLTEAEQHQLRLAHETREKLIDLAARFDVSVLDEMLANPKTERI